MLLHRSDLNISEIFRHFFSHFLAKFAKIHYFWILFTDFAQILMKFCRNFANIFENVENNIPEFLNFRAKVPELSSFEGVHIIFWIGARACPYSRVVSRSPPRFLRAVCFPFLGFPAAPSCTMGRMLLRWSGFSWFSTDSKNSERTLIWIVRMVRSLANRTFQPRLWVGVPGANHLLLQAV